MEFNFNDFENVKKAELKLDKNDSDNTYKVTVVCDDKDAIIFSHVPSQYVKEDQVPEKDKKELSDEDSIKLTKQRINVLLSQIRQCIFTAKLYGANINGSITTIEKDEK